RAVLELFEQAQERGQDLLGALAPQMLHDQKPVELLFGKIKGLQHRRSCQKAVPALFLDRIEQDNVQEVNGRGFYTRLYCAQAGYICASNYAHESASGFDAAD